MLPPPPSSSAATAVAAVLTHITLLLLIQARYPLVIAPVLRKFCAQGYDIRSPEGDEEYDEMLDGHARLLADAIGFIGDATAADALLRVWPAQDLSEVVLRVGARAVIEGHLHVLDWMLAHRADIPDATQSFASLVQLATYLDRIDTLEWFDERLGRAYVKQAITDTKFMAMSLCRAPRALRWLAERDITTTPDFVENCAMAEHDFVRAPAQEE